MHQDSSSNRIHPGATCGIAVALYLLGLALICIAFGFSENPALRSSVFARLSLDLPPILPSRAALFFTLALVVLFAGYALLLRWIGADSSDAKRRSGWGVLILLTLVFLAIPPYLSTDVFSYYQQGWIFAAKGASPYVVPPNAFLHFPGVAYLGGKNEDVLSPYGPLWTHLEALVYLLSAGRVWVGVVLFKMAAGAAALLTGYFSFRILSIVSPGEAMRGAVLFAANPLILIEAAGMGHNDVVALSITFLGLWLLLRSDAQRALGLAVIGLALLVKAQVAVVLLALGFYWFHKAELLGLIRSSGKAALLFAPLACLLGWPFVSTPSDVGFFFGRAIAHLDYELKLTPVNLMRSVAMQLASTSGWTLDPDLVKALLIVASFGIAAALALRVLWTSRDLADGTYRAGPVYLFATVAGSYWRQWYAMWPLPFVALGPHRPWTVAVIAYCALALLTYTVTRSSGAYFTSCSDILQSILVLLA